MKGEIKKNLLKMLSKDMSGMMSEGRELPKKGMAVKVVAKDEAGLKKGLSKAEELLKMKYGEESEDESEEMDEESCEMPEMGESEESEEESEDVSDLEKQLAELQAKIAAKKA